MSESMERSRQATSGWRRTNVAAIAALFAFILARFTLRNRLALPARVPTAKRSAKLPGKLPGKAAASADDALDSQIRLRLPVTMASAPPDFTARVLTRIAAAPAPAVEMLPVKSPRVSLVRTLRVVGGTLTVALLLMLATGVFVTVVNPTLAVAILDALMSLALGLLALGRTLGQLLGRATATPWIIPATMGGLLGFLLLSWTQLARQLGRDPQEA